MSAGVVDCALMQIPLPSRRWNAYLPLSCCEMPALYRPVRWSLVCPDAHLTFRDDVATPRSPNLHNILWWLLKNFTTAQGGVQGSRYEAFSVHTVPRYAHHPDWVDVTSGV